MHKDIIPQEYLPTFNSRTIEMFIHRIPDLDERFLYFNDDMFPLLPCDEGDFFAEDKIRTGFSRHLFPWNSYKSLIRDCDRFAREAAGVRPCIAFLRPQHTVSPMLKSVCEDLSDKCREGILSSLSRVRQKGNLGQYVFADYAYFCGKAENHRISSKHMPLAHVSAASLEACFAAPQKKLICLNDGIMDEAGSEALRAAIGRCFMAKFPHKSRFEL